MTRQKPIVDDRTGLLDVLVDRAARGVLTPAEGAMLRAAVTYLRNDVRQSKQTARGIQPRIEQLAAERNASTARAEQAEAALAVLQQRLDDEHATAVTRARDTDRVRGQLAAAEARIAAVRAVADQMAASRSIANMAGLFTQRLSAALDEPAVTTARPAAPSHDSNVWEDDDGWRVSCRDCPAYVDNIGSSSDAEDWADEHKAQATLNGADDTPAAVAVDTAVPEMPGWSVMPMVSTPPWEEAAAEPATLAAWLKGMRDHRIWEGITVQWLGRIEHDGFPAVADETLPPGEIHLRPRSTCECGESGAPHDPAWCARARHNAGVCDDADTPCPHPDHAWEHRQEQAAPVPEVTLSTYVDGGWQEVPGVTAVSVDRDPWVTLTSGTVTIGTGPDAYTVHLGEQAPRPRGLAQVFAEAIDRVALTLTEPFARPFPDVRARVAAILASTPRCPARFTAGPPELTDDQCAREPGHFGQHFTADRLWTWAPSGPAGHRTNPLYDSLLLGSDRPAAVPRCCICGSLTHGGRKFYENYLGHLFCWPCADGDRPTCPLGDQCAGVNCPRLADHGPRPEAGPERPAGWCPTCEGHPRRTASAVQQPTTEETTR
jgi:hypothetical protein